MKRLLFLFVIASIALYSCSKDDENPDNGPSQAEIIGTWDAQYAFTSIKADTIVYQDTTNFNDDDKYAKITFNKDQTYTSISKEDSSIEKDSGTYLLQGNSLKINSNSNTEDSLLVPRMDCMIEDNEMVLSYDTTVVLPTTDTSITATLNAELHLIKE